MKIITTLLLALMLATSAHAGGYRVATQGQKALAMGHTGVAMSETAEVVFFNPGAMTQLEADRDFTGGIFLLASETLYQNADTLVEEETDSPLGTPINAYYTSRISDELSWGLGVYTPYGNKVEWPTDWAGSHLVNNIELASIFIQPTIGYQLNDSTSIGFGPALVIGAVEFNRNLTTSLVDDDGNRSDVTIEASNLIEWGYNLGILHKISDKLTFGASYRSEVVVEARGEDAEFNDIPTALQGTGPNQFPAETEFDAELPLPAELTLGIAYQASDKLTLAFDINRTFWDTFERLLVEFETDDPDQPRVSDNPRFYEDSNIYRFGMQYQYSDQWTFRAGIYFDDTPIPDGSFEPITPRGDSIGYTGGATYRYSKNLDFDISLLIVTFEDEEYTYEYYDEPPGSGAFIPFTGTYDSAANSIGFGLTYRY